MENNGVQIPVSTIDNTQPGLNAALNSATKMSNKIAKELVIEVQTKFPNLAGMVDTFEKEVREANRKISKFEFAGTRYGKKGNILGDLTYDLKDLKGKLSYDEINALLPKLKELQAGLTNGTIKSVNIGGFKNLAAEKKFIDDTIVSLEVLQQKLDAVFRSNKKRITLATNQKSEDQLQKEIAATERLVVLNKQIADSKNRLIGANFDKNYKAQIKYNNEIAKLLRERYRITLDIKDFEEAKSYEDAARFMSKQLQYKKEYIAHQKKQISYEKLFNQEVNKGNGGLLAQSKILGKLGDFAKRYFSIFAIFNLAKRIAETTGYFEQQQVALEGILGSASKAQTAISKIKSIALQSPFQTKELVAYTKQLSAFGVENDVLVDKMKDLADISAGLGVDMDRIILAYGQVKSASVLRGQELRQFTEAGIPMVQALADKFTALNGKLVTTGEVFELISRRKVSFEMVSSVLSGMTAEGGKFYKMQENLTDTLYGQIQKLKDMWTLALNDAGGAISPFLNGIIKAIQEIIKNARAFLSGGALLAIYASIGRVARIIKNMKPDFTAIKIETKMIGVEWFNAGFAIQKAGTTTDKLLARMKRLKAVSVQTAKALWSVLSSPIGGLVTSIATGLIMDAVAKANEFKNSLSEIDRTFSKDTKKLTSGLDSLLGKLANLTEGTKAYNDALLTLKTNYKDYVNPEIIDQLIAEQKELATTSDSWTVLKDSIKAAIEAKQNYNKYEAKSQKASSAVLEDASATSIWRLGKSPLGKEVKNIQDLLKNNVNNSWYKYGGEDFINKNFDTEKVATIVDNAAQSFFDNGHTTFDEFKNELINQTKIMAPELLQIISDYSEGLFRVYSSQTGFSAYVTNEQLRKGTNQYKIDKAFKDVADRAYIGTLYEKTNDEQKNMQSALGYNPYQTSSQQQKDFLKATLGLIKQYNGFWNTSDFKGATGGTATKEEKTAAYNAFKDLQKVMVDGINNFDQGSSYAINKALMKFARSLQGSAVQFADIMHISSNLVTNVGTKSADAARVSTLIQERYGNSSKQLTGPYSADFLVQRKKFFSKYGNVTDDTFESTRQGLIEDYQSKQKEIDSYKDKGGVWKERIDNLKQEMKWLEELGSTEYFNIDVTGGKKSSSTRIESEMNEWVNTIKNAYENYKLATQSMGVEMGVQYMKNNKEMQRLFAGYFNGSQQILDKDGNNVKIGKSGPTIQDVLKDSFISTGVETGVLDFAKGIEAVADAMEKYYEADKDTRKSFESQAKSLRQWAASISKDNVKAWIDSVNKALKDLNTTFQNIESQIKTYQELLKNGTAGKLGGYLDITKQSALTPDSVQMRELLTSMVGTYNSQLAAVAGTSANNLSIGNLQNMSIGGLQNLIDKISEQVNLNNDKFSADKFGQPGQQIVDVLKQYISTIENELKSISGETVTGNTLEDIIANALMRVGIASDNFKKATTLQQSLGIRDNGAAANLLNQSIYQGAEETFKKFLESQNFESLAEGILMNKNVDLDALKEKLEEILNKIPEVDENGNSTSPLKDKIRQKFDAYAGQIGQMQAEQGSFKTLKTAFDLLKNAPRRNEEEWQRLNERNDELSYPGHIRTPEEEAEYQRNNQRIDELGDHGDKQSSKDIQLALKSISTFGGNASSTFSMLTSGFSDLISAGEEFTAVMDELFVAFAGEDSPEWMQDTEDFLSEFNSAFKMVIAPITAVISLIAALATGLEALAAAGLIAEAALSPLLIVMLAIVAAAALIAVVVALAKKHDKDLEKANEELKESIENCDRAITVLNNTMKNYNDEAERLAGQEKFAKQMDAVALNANIAAKELEKARLAQQQYNNEEEKKKTDDSKLAEYSDAISEANQNAIEAMNTLKNSVKEALEDITGTTEDWSNAIASAIRNAFQEGENAARAFRSTVKEMMGDMLTDVLTQQILMPAVQAELDKLTDYQNLSNKLANKELNGTQFVREAFSGFLDPESVKSFEESLQIIGDAWIDTIDNLDPAIKDYISFKDKASSLTGGIDSTTEDTARRLEALQNSTLGETILIRLNSEDLLNETHTMSASLKSLEGYASAIKDNTKAMREVVDNVHDIGRGAIKVSMVL